MYVLRYIKLSHRMLIKNMEGYPWNFVIRNNIYISNYKISGS